MNSQTIVMCVVALLLGMLLTNMLKSVCGCKTVEGQLGCIDPDPKVVNIVDRMGDFTGMSLGDHRFCFSNDVHNTVFAKCNVAKFPDQCNDELLDNTEYSMCGCKWDGRDPPPGMCRAIDRYVDGDFRRCDAHLNNRVACLANDVCQWCDTDENGIPKADTCISGRSN